MGTFNVRNERGIALVVAIVALVVIGAIVAGTFFVSTLEQRTSFNTVQTTQAFDAAEAGLQDATANWNTGWNLMPTNTTQGPYTVSGFGGGSSYSYQITRLNDQVFLLKSTGTLQGATQTLASLIRLTAANVQANGAVTSGGNVQVGGNAVIDGRNTTPTGWSSASCPPAPDKAGVSSSGSISSQGNPTIYGSPQEIQHDPTITSSTFQTPFDQLKQTANLTFAGGQGQGNYVTFPSLAPVGTSTTCDRTNLNNWGEPLRTGSYVAGCITYAPIVLINGNASFPSGGRGQGILLVDGDLAIAGGFQWVGLVIATGQVKTGNGTSNVTGAILAQNADFGDQTSFSGTPVVSYSKCALDYVLNIVALGRPLAGRSWAQLF